MKWSLQPVNSFLFQCQPNFVVPFGSKKVFDKSLLFSGIYFLLDWSQTIVCKPVVCLESITLNFE